jgi:hypothetical protein
MYHHDSLWHIHLPFESVFAVLSFILPSIQMRVVVRW